MKSVINIYINILGKLKDLPPLFFRAILVYGFFEPAYNKIQDINSVATWFESLGYPLPLLNAYMATLTEWTGIILLTLGLGVRFITPPLMFVMIIAATTVHWKNGFACGHNGFEIPFYYFFMLFGLLVSGAGKFSLDYLIKRKN
jgi:putative oxidoreductase